MNHLKHIIITFVLLFANCVAEQQTVSCPAIMSYVQEQLPHYGVLKSINGFFYVDVDDEYIHQLVHMIGEAGFEEPPYFGPGLIGAHISVIYKDESKKYGINEIEDCGEFISFIPIECQVVNPGKWVEMQAVYIIVVDSPELDAIRAAYGLPKREYPFHITIGVKPALVGSY